ncbi:MAG: hypothetical protein KC777_26155 [Cyanobacteria bacterium HKST-UBA02]|nr:hypothetical protein [Cyanobacteria bacterium HKST-UBA02]
MNIQNAYPGSQVTAEPFSIVFAGAGSRVKARRRSIVVDQGASSIEKDDECIVLDLRKVEPRPRRCFFVKDRATCPPGSITVGYPGSRISAGKGATILACEGSHIDLEAGCQAMVGNGSTVKTASGCRVTPLSPCSLCHSGSRKLRPVAGLAGADREFELIHQAIHHILVY